MFHRTTSPSQALHIGVGPRAVQLGVIIRMRVQLFMGLCIGLLGACSEQSPEVLGPSATTIDSVAWKKQHANRPAGLFLTETMTTCGEGATCSFFPVNYQCGAPKAECGTQQSPITVNFTSMIPKTVVVSGSGALLCNETMGTVTAYDSLDMELASVDLVPIAPSDCGQDNITFGGTGTLTDLGGIDHIVIDPMSPFTFPVGGGTGVASAFYTVQLNEDAIPFQVSCTATVVRAEAVTCTATPTDSGNGGAITGWKFYGPENYVHPRSTDTTSTTWSGKLLMSGHVEVRTTINGTPFPLPIRSNDIAVTPRDWSQVSSTIRFGQKSPSLLRDSVSTIERQLGRGNVALPALGIPNPSLTWANDQGPNDPVFYYTASPYILEDSVRINETMAVNSVWYNKQETSDRFVNFGQGNRFFMCGRSRVPQMNPIIEAHEGVSWTTQPNSHAAAYFRAADSVIRLKVESTVGEDILIDSLAAQTFRAAIGVSNRVADTLFNNIIMGPAPDSLVSVGGVQCKFRYFATVPETP
jgi:hypothetical protein